MVAFCHLPLVFGQDQDFWTTTVAPYITDEFVYRRRRSEESHESSAIRGRKEATNRLGWAGTGWKQRVRNATIAIQTTHTAQPVGREKDPGSKMLSVFRTVPQ